MEGDVRKRKAIAYWLIAGVLMIIVQTLLGGITRLTGSGLSITEWKPIMGALPPLNEHEWNKAFDGYKQIAQFKYVNSHFNLADFKHIFFWEWLHRLWARLLGVVFAAGFVYFLAKKYFSKEMLKPFIVLFILGGLQGLIGWIMVKTGLNSEDVHVSHIALAIHFISAMILACYTLWFALQLLVPGERRIVAPHLQNFTIIVIAVLFLQLTYGAFMAGLKAAMVAHTWPDINGSYLPETLQNSSLISQPINVHFMHREIAYVLFTLVMFWFGFAGRYAKKNAGSLLASTRWWPFLLVFTQVLLGIITVLSATQMTPGKFGAFEALAELHQMVAMFLLMSLVVNLYVIKRRA